MIIKRMINKLKQFFKKKPKYSNMERHEVAGHVFYTWRLVDKLPTSRESLFLAAFQDMDYSASTENLIEFTELMIECFDQGKMSDVGYMLKQQEANLKAFTNINNLLRVANALILIEGEDLLKVSSEFSNKKMRLAQKHSEVYNFFLRRSLQRIQAISNSEIDIEQAIEEISGPLSQIEKDFLSMIGKTVYSVT